MHKTSNHEVDKLQQQKTSHGSTLAGREQETEAIMSTDSQSGQEDFKESPGLLKSLHLSSLGDPVANVTYDVDVNV